MEFDLVISRWQRRRSAAGPAVAQRVARPPPKGLWLRSGNQEPMAALSALELLYVFFSVTLTLSGLMMVSLAANAYVQTERREMLSLAIGFSIIVAAAIATTVSAFKANFDNAIVLLTTNYAITTFGYLFVIDSVVDRY
jgi:hypothetical protein